mmetsp:Transcript_106045/g.182960  ORF Transcript_106045/g.182960 Transcript_106045/m.182960 type:complete len:203 (-) Transcript_106045:498-1106(-)
MVATSSTLLYNDFKPSTSSFIPSRVATSALSCSISWANAPFLAANSSEQASRTSDLSSASRSVSTCWTSRRMPSRWVRPSSSGFSTSIRPICSGDNSWPDMICTRSCLTCAVRWVRAALTSAWIWVRPSAIWASTSCFTSLILPSSRFTHVSTSFFTSALTCANTMPISPLMLSKSAAVACVLATSLKAIIATSASERLASI